MSNVVVISDSEDSDDCVIESVTFLEDKENNSELYDEVRKENELLAQFIKKCLTLENTKGMIKTLKHNLLRSYYNADKAARESLKFQKNLRRANHLLNTEPHLKYSHLSDLCDILDSFKAKKKVPFVTLTRKLQGNNGKSNKRKRPSTENLDGASNSKVSKDANDAISPFSETVNLSLNVSSCSVQDESQDLGLSSQQSCSSENGLLVEKARNTPSQVRLQKRIETIENKIAFFKQKVTALDEMEVHDDNVNSPYIISERLKREIVCLYKELCKLKGTRQVKRKGIRLKLTEGHPPGPTRELEKFLNRNFNSDGDPEFPDFCDVVTCVSEANEKDDLGWTKPQIMKEATLLFTLCGRALQKRRQNREYRDLMHRVKLEEFNRDPADDDPGLLAALEENRRLAIKKESDIMERYTMMQYLPPKTKSQKSNSNIDTGKESDVDVEFEDDVQKEIVNNHNKEGVENEIAQRVKDESENVCVNSALKSIDDDIMNLNKSDVNLASERNKEIAVDVNKIVLKADTVKVKNVSKSVQLDNVENTLHTAQHCDNDQIIIMVRNKTVKAKNIVPSVDSVNNNDSNVLEKNDVVHTENKILGEVLIQSQVKRKTQKNLGLFDKWERDFTVRVEIMSDSENL